MMQWLHRLRTAAVVFAFLGVFLYVFSLNFRSPGKMDYLQRLVVESIGPLIKIMRNGSKSLEDVVKEYVWLRQARRENELLKSQVAKLEQQLTDYQEAYVENLRLRRLVDFKNTTQTQSIAAQVVVHDLTGWFQTLVIDKGFRDHVESDMAVVNDVGVVGRVLDVSDRYCRVLLITDPGSAVDAIVQRNRVRGILSGKDANTCILKYVRSNLDVQVGDLIITSGKDGVFPKGLRLGIVQGTFKDPVDLFQKVEVRPLVRLGALEEVLIVKRDMNLPETSQGN
jgi:rod shape-determining protein MreC